LKTKPSVSEADFEGYDRPRLLLAVYQRALVDSQLSPTCPRNRRLRQEATAWLNGEHRDGAINLSDVKSAVEELTRQDPDPRIYNIGAM
jgi:hypothetical protein